MANVYYDPEEFGLEIVGVADEPGLSYEFNTFAVWKDKNSILYYARDSGCSCPTPFEDYAGVEELTKLDTPTQLQFLLAEWRGEGLAPEVEQLEWRSECKQLIEACEPYFRKSA